MSYIKTFYGRSVNYVELSRVNATLFSSTCSPLVSMWWPLDSCGLTIMAITGSLQYQATIWRWQQETIGLGYICMYQTHSKSTTRWQQQQLMISQDVGVSTMDPTGPGLALAYCSSGWVLRGRAWPAFRHNQRVVTLPRHCFVTLNYYGYYSNGSHDGYSHWAANCVAGQQFCGQQLTSGCC